MRRASIAWIDMPEALFLPSLSLPVFAMPWQYGSTTRRKLSVSNSSRTRLRIESHNRVFMSVLLFGPEL
jgi:hypothetical protein